MKMSNCIKHMLSLLILGFFFQCSLFLIFQVRNVFFHSIFRCLKKKPFLSINLDKDFSKKEKKIKIRYKRTSLKSGTGACKTALGNSLVILFRRDFWGWGWGWFASCHRSIISLDTQVILLFLLNLLQLILNKVCCSCCCLCCLAMPHVFVGSLYP